MVQVSSPGGVDDPGTKGYAREAPVVKSAGKEVSHLEQRCDLLTKVYPEEGTVRLYAYFMVLRVLRVNESTFLAHFDPKVLTLHVGRS